MDIGRLMEEIVVADPREELPATGTATLAAGIDELGLERDLGVHAATAA